MIYFISLICVLLPSYLIRFSVFGIPTTLLEILIYIAATTGLVSCIKYGVLSKKPNIHNAKYTIPILLFIIAGIISVIISPDKQGALGIFKAYIFDPILLFWVIINVIKSKRDYHLIIKSLIISGLLVAIHAIWQKIFGNVAIDGRVVGVFGYSPNYLALFLCPLAILSFGYGMLAEKKIWWIYILAFIIMLLAIWFSGSRAGLIAVLGGFLSWFILKYWIQIKSKRIFIILLYSLIALLLLLGCQTIKPNWQAGPDAGRVSSSNNIRWEIWKTTTKDIFIKNDKWILGVGLGNYQNYFINLTKDRVNYPEWIAPMALTPHNIFLTIWVNMGLLGLVSFVWLLIIFFQNTRYYILNTKNLNAYSFMLIATMITLIIQGLVDSPYWKNDLSAMFWIFIALSVAFFSKNILYENKKA